MNVPQAIVYLSAQLSHFAEQLQRDRAALATWSCLPESHYVDKDILDLGCGWGAGCAAFLERGARFAWGIDPVLTSEMLSHLSVLPQSRFTAGILAPEVFVPQRFDLVYAHFTTEHIYNLARVMGYVFELLKPGGHFVCLHDNYYAPMGGHDHAFIGPAPGKDRILQSKAPPCWKSPHKCAASATFRQEAEQQYDWTLKGWTLTPSDCSLCSYYHRAQLWGHLLFQEYYRKDFPGDFFQTRLECGLNKVTPFQLRQFLVEAGFDLVTWERSMINNVPPPELTRLFPIDDLQTGCILFAGAKPNDTTGDRRTQQA